MRKKNNSGVEGLKNINKILDYFGSIYNLSKHLGISTCAIYQWKKIPKIRAYQIEIITEGKIKSTTLI
jgi:hypothetical protein